MEDLSSINLLERLDTDVRKILRRAVEGLDASQVRYLVDLYYQIQEFRKASACMGDSAGAGEPNVFMDQVFQAMKTIEMRIKSAMDWWTDKQPAAIWTKSLFGFGPVIAAGLSAHIAIERTPNASHLWSFAGLHPLQKWEASKRRPWNARLKTLCWKIGDCIVKFSGDERCYYAKFYLEEKAKQIACNERGEFASVAKAKLESCTWRDKKSPTYLAYKAGRLPDGRIHLRACRRAVKLFLSHWWEVSYFYHHGKRPEFKPWIIEHGGHWDYIPPPNFEPDVT